METEFVDLEKYKISRYDEEKKGMNLVAQF